MTLIEELTAEFQRRDEHEQQSREMAMERLVAIIRKAYAGGGNVSDDDTAEALQILDMLDKRPNFIAERLNVLPEIEAIGQRVDTDEGPLRARVTALEAAVLEAVNKSQDFAQKPYERKEWEAKMLRGREQYAEASHELEVLTAAKLRLADIKATYPDLFAGAGV